MEINEMTDMTKAEKAYDGDQIQVLEGLEAVRKRPGMYIGSTGPRGLHHLVYEIVDNAIDEALAGFCDKIDVRLLPGNVVYVSDNGRGIPVGVQHKTGLPAVTVVFTILHAGGKFGGGSYKVSGGLHGVGASVVNALSTWLEVEVVSEGQLYFQRFERGKAVTQLENRGPAPQGRERGTVVRFQADPEIFKETTVYEYEVLQKRLREQAFLNAGVHIQLTDERPAEDRPESERDRETAPLWSTSTPARTCCTRMSSTSPPWPRTRTPPRKWPCNTPTPTRSRFSALPTTSAPPTAAPTRTALSAPSPG